LRSTLKIVLFVVLALVYGKKPSTSLVFVAEDEKRIR